MMDRQIDRPIPVPYGFVVKNGWKMRSAFSGSIPGPESSTMINTPSGSPITDFTRSVQGAIGDGVHSFNRIRNQIGDHLLQLDPIRQYRWKTGNQLRLDRNLLVSATWNAAAQ